MVMVIFTVSFDVFDSVASKKDDPSKLFAQSYFNHWFEKAGVYSWLHRYFWMGLEPCMTSIWKSLFDKSIKTRVLWHRPKTGGKITA